LLVSLIAPFLSHSQKRYRTLEPDDHPVLQALHRELFPVDYDNAFFYKATHGLDEIVSWAVIAPAPDPLITTNNYTNDDDSPSLQSTTTAHSTYLVNKGTEEMVAFATAKPFKVCQLDLIDRVSMNLYLPSSTSSSLENTSVLYLLTLGVSPNHQRKGLALKLLSQLKHHALGISDCCAMFLHVATFNKAAMGLYERAGFQRMAELPDHYEIKTNRQPDAGRTKYDGCLFMLDIIKGEEESDDNSWVGREQQENGVNITQYIVSLFDKLKLVRNSNSNGKQEKKEQQEMHWLTWLFKRET
jgi:histone acetyltransferase MCC1